MGGPRHGMRAGNRYVQIRLLQAKGLSPQEVANKLGISYSTVMGRLGDPTGEAMKKRKQRYAGVCQDCGGPTNGSEGPGKAGKRCLACNAAHQRSLPRRWTKERIIDAIQRFADENGRPPTATEWIHANREKGYPPVSSVYSKGPFARWSDAIEAAGFPRPISGQYQVKKRRPRPDWRPQRKTVDARGGSYSLTEIVDDLHARQTLRSSKTGALK